MSTDTAQKIFYSGGKRTGFVRFHLHNKEGFHEKECGGNSGHSDDVDNQFRVPASNYVCRVMSTTVGKVVLQCETIQGLSVDDLVRLNTIRKS